MLLKHDMTNVIINNNSKPKEFIIIKLTMTIIKSPNNETRLSSIKCYIQQQICLNTLKYITQSKILVASYRKTSDVTHLPWILNTDLKFNNIILELKYITENFINLNLTKSDMNFRITKLVLKKPKENHTKY